MSVVKITTTLLVISLMSTATMAGMLKDVSVDTMTIKIALAEAKQQRSNSNSKSISQDRSYEDGKIKLNQEQQHEGLNNQQNDHGDNKFMWLRDPVRSLGVIRNL